MLNYLMPFVVVLCLFTVLKSLFELAMNQLLSKMFLTFEYGDRKLELRYWKLFVKVSRYLQILGIITGSITFYITGYIIWATSPGVRETVSNLSTILK